MNAVDLYPWIKALHVAAAMGLVAGVIAAAVVLPAVSGEGAGARHRALVRHLHLWHRAVTTPCLVAVWGLGVGLASLGEWFAQPWLHAKLALVVLLSALHGVQSGALRRMAGGDDAPAAARWRLAPAALALTTAIVALVVA